MAEFLTAVQWVRLLLAQFRWRPCIDDGITRRARPLDEATRAAAAAQRSKDGCAGCHYYVATHGACHVQPPVQQRGDNHPWPAVKPDDWCGAFSSAFGDEA